MGQKTEFATPTNTHRSAHSAVETTFFWKGRLCMSAETVEVTSAKGNLKDITPRKRHIENPPPNAHFDEHGPMLAVGRVDPSVTLQRRCQDAANAQSSPSSSSNFPRWLLACDVKSHGQEGLFATSGRKMIDPLVVKHSLFRGSPIFSQKVANRPPCARPPVKRRSEWRSQGQTKRTKE